MSLITLLTDFGTQDYFVGAVKGTILSLNPAANILDISHDIPPQDIQAAAFTLLCCYQSFPTGTIHVAVVDPGVGSDRKPILIQCAQQFFVGPDNGIFSWICDREKDWLAIHLTNDRFFQHPISNTFHGRDIFAPVAAALSNQVEPNNLGESLREVVRLDSLDTLSPNEKTLQGRVIHIDRFGNCVTNLTQNNLSEIKSGDGVKLEICGREVTSFRKTFSDNPTSGDSDLSCIVGSAGFLEVVAADASAVAILNAHRGDMVRLIGA